MRGGNGSGFNSRGGGGQMIMRGGFNSRGRGFPRGGGFNSGGFRGNGMSNGRGSDRGDRGGRGRFPPNQGSNGPPQQHQGKRIIKLIVRHSTITRVLCSFSTSTKSSASCC